jgi:hypothetical protein
MTGVSEDNKEMAETSNNRRGSRDCAPELQCSIITLRKAEGLKWRDIIAKTGVPESIACRVYSKALHRAGGHEPDLEALLAAVPANPRRPGRPLKVKDGSELSREIRSEIIKFKD